MSNNDTTLNKSSTAAKPNKKDRIDVELNFLKKANEKYPLRSSPGVNEQGEKRNRTTSDEEYDSHMNGSGTPKRSRSGQRKSRTITNSFYTATSTCNYNDSRTRMGKTHNQSDMNQSKSNVTSQGFKFDISNNAITYATEQTLPAIRLDCEPKVTDQKAGTGLIKEFIRLIEHDFKQINKKKKDPVGFETWFIDKNGNLLCITRNIDLFIYLCDIQHIPNKILDTNIKVILPKHLPPQRSIIIKGVSNLIHIDDVKFELTRKYESIYAYEEIIGTNNGKSRYIRIDMLNSGEYNQLLNSGVICIDGQCLHIVEFLAAPRVLFCPKCNEPGHGKKNCRLTYDRCKRCGEERSKGVHNECEIRCRNCKADHISTNFKCPAVQDYRRDLILHLQQHPELLPDDTHLFIPSQYRQQGEKTLGTRRYHPSQKHYEPFRNNMNNTEGWPSIPQPNQPAIFYNKYSSAPSPDIINDIHLQIKQIENACSSAKEEYDRKNIEIISQVKTSITQIHSLIACFSTIIQKQNETISVLKNTMTECLEFNRITNQALIFVMAKSGDQQYLEMSKQLSLIPFTERQNAVDKIFSTYTPLIDTFTMKLLEVMKQLNDNND